MESMKQDIPDLQYLKGVGPYRLKLLRSLGITSMEQLLCHFPRRYERVMTRRIEDVQDGELATVVGTVAGSHVSQGRVKVVRLLIEEEDEGQGEERRQGRQIHGVWFNQIRIPKSFPSGTPVAVTGKIRLEDISTGRRVPAVAQWKDTGSPGQWNDKVPEILVTNIEKRPLTSQRAESAQQGDSAGSLVPVYPETAGLNSKALRTIMSHGLAYSESLFPEILPEGEELRSVPRAEAYRQMHRPDNEESLHSARRRLICEEVLMLQLAFACMRSQPKAETASALEGETEELMAFARELPFALTEAQGRALKEISADLKQRSPMRRLLQGDVGSGKTVVAMMALLQAVTSGYQGTVMAPTEVLAQQHFQTLDTFFTPRGIRVCLLTGSQTQKERRHALEDIRSGTIQVVVGTSALIQEGVRFASLGLVVADEQHRFGVRQRTLLQDKGENPHVLVMTATPIPRTLALTVYGDLQLSVLDEMPAGRQKIVTRLVQGVGRQMCEFMEQHMSQGRQIYVVCPLVEETETSDFMSATRRYEQLCERFAKYRVVLLHGRMKSQEKESVMQGFRQGEIDMLVATTVIEVGVDVPNATIMVIENA